MLLNPELRAELDALYRDLDAEISSQRPRCDRSGRCCRFAEFGHRLYLSAVEADRLVEVEPGIGVRVVEGHCPYQEGTVCVARERRPLGCRIYFCDPSFAAAMPELSERFIARLKALHQKHQVGWDYRRLEDHLADRFPQRCGTVQGSFVPRSHGLEIVECS